MLLRVLAASLAVLATWMTAAQAAPPPAEAFARVPALDSVSLSPDGKHLAAVVSPDGAKTLVAIWKTDAMDQPPVQIGVHPRQRVYQVQFVKNDRLAVTTQQTIDFNFDAGMTRTHLFKTILTDLTGKVQMQLLPASRERSEIAEQFRQLVDPIVLSGLPGDPRLILVQDTRLGGAGDVYKVDVYTGKADRVLRGGERTFGEQADARGEVRARLQQGYDGGKTYIAQWIRHPDSGEWQEHFRSYAADREPVEVVGFDPADRNIAYVASSRGRDRAAIYEYDIRARKLGATAFEHKLFEAGGMVTSAKGEILGFTYLGETPRVHWLDGRLESIEKTAREALGGKTVRVAWTDPAGGQTANIAIPDGFDVTIADWSQDGRQVVIQKSGPRQPPEYYLLTDGKTLRLLGKSRPWVDTASLGDTRLVQYKARDGLMIPAFLTTPPKSVFGEGPYPAIVLPHGGPWSRDSLDWDPTGWTQYFASRGYVVLQPQFRGSEGWGQKLWRAGDAEWGQKMQDDKDDGARWLVEQKLTAPDRIAIHGYSYGGYAAFAGAVRPDTPYQCAIAGAGVAELASFQAETWEDRFIREYQRPTIKGLDPLAEAGKLRIPLLIYHGDRDEIVPIKQSRMFRDRSPKAKVKFIEYKDMGHPYVTWSPQDTAQILTSVEDFLKKDCGPGGL
jgi:dipeptidyl aminopeptidase/acylaminoacyl peptidase